MKKWITKEMAIFVLSQRPTWSQKRQGVTQLKHFQLTSDQCRQDVWGSMVDLALRNCSAQTHWLRFKSYLSLRYQGFKKTNNNALCTTGVIARDYFRSFAMIASLRTILNTYCPYKCCSSGLTEHHLSLKAKNDVVCQQKEIPDFVFALRNSFHILK